MPSSRGSSQPRDQTWVSYIVGRHFTIWATREVINKGTWALIASDRLQMSVTTLQKHKAMEEILLFILVSSPGQFVWKTETWLLRVEDESENPSLAPSTLPPCAQLLCALPSTQRHPRGVMKESLTISHLDWLLLLGSGTQVPCSLPGTSWLPDNCLVSRQGLRSFQRTSDVKRSLFITSGEVIC